jgi:hypothetical protein
MYDRRWHEILKVRRISMKDWKEGFEGGAGIN